MDDLSFEEFEIEYKYLKAVIEGGLERKPENVLIYATSNRRHLIRETFKDKADRDEELHTNDTVQEKLSLVARFGVTIYFGSPDKKSSRRSCACWRSAAASTCRKSSCSSKQTNGNWPTADCPEGRRSSLSTICWGRKGKFLFSGQPDS